MLEVGQAPDVFERFGYKWNKSPIFAGIQQKNLNEFKEKTVSSCRTVFHRLISLSDLIFLYSMMPQKAEPILVTSKHSEFNSELNEQYL